MRTDASRYARQLDLDGFGPGAQAKLATSTVLIVGAGGLGCSVAPFLAGAGVGALLVVDDDVVSETDLHRQVAYGLPDVGAPKVAALARRLLAANPGVRVDPILARLDSVSAARLVRCVDVVVDGSDTFETRFAVNDACVAAGVPLVSGAVDGYFGQAAVWWPPVGPCYRCVYPVAPSAAVACANSGVLGPLCAVVGGIMAAEAIKLLAGVGEPLVGALALYDAAAGEGRRVAVTRSATCPTCGAGPRLAVATGATIPQIGVDDARALMARGAVTFVDCREDAPDVLPGALHIPFGALIARPRRVPSGAATVVYCETGALSLAAVAALRESGRDAWSLRGGLAAWRTRASLDDEPLPARVALPG